MMEEKKLVYLLSYAQADFLAGLLDKVQVAWIQNNRMLVSIYDLLSKPENADELEKEQFEKMKAKYEPINAVGTK